MLRPTPTLNFYLFSIYLGFSDYYNWLRYSMLPPSFYFKNRLFIESRRTNRLIYSNFRSVFRGFDWVTFKSNSISEFLIKQNYRFVSLCFIFVCIVAAIIHVSFSGVLILPDFIVGDWVYYIIWRLGDIFCFWIINFTYLFFVLLGSWTIATINFFVPTGVNIYSVLSKHYVDDFYQRFGVDLFYLTPRIGTREPEVIGFMEPSSAVLNSASGLVHRTSVASSSLSSQLPLTRLLYKLSLNTRHHFADLRWNDYINNKVSGFLNLSKPNPVTPNIQLGYSPHQLVPSKILWTLVDANPESAVPTTILETQTTDLLKSSSNLLRHLLPNASPYRLSTGWVNTLDRLFTTGQDLNPSTLFAIRRQAVLSNVSTLYGSLHSSVCPNSIVGMDRSVGNLELDLSPVVTLTRSLNVELRYALSALAAAQGSTKHLSPYMRRDYLNLVSITNSPSVSFTPVTLLQPSVLSAGSPYPGRTAACDLGTLTR